MPGISRMSRWGCSIPSIALQKVLYETFVYDLESCWISCCHNKVLSRFYLVFWWEYFLLILQLQVHCYLVNIFLHSHRSRPTKHEQISSRCASSQKEKGAAAIICTAVRTVRVQTIRLETVSREWNEGLLFHCRIIGDEQICRICRICLPFGACLGGLCWTAPRVHASVVGFLSSPERTQSVPYLQIYRVFSMAMSFVWTLGSQFVWVLSVLLFRLICSGSSWRFCEQHQNREARPTGSYSSPTFCHSFSLFLCVCVCVCAQCSWFDAGCTIVLRGTWSLALPMKSIRKPYSK